MSEQVKPVHRQLLEIGQRAFYHPDDTYTGKLSWQSREHYKPQLVISNTRWVEVDGRRTLASAAFVMRVDGLDSEVHVDGAITTDYLNDAYGLDFLEKFQGYFADPKNLALEGLVIAQGLPARIMTDAYRYKPGDADFLRIASA